MCNLYMNFTSCSHRWKRDDDADFSGTWESVRNLTEQSRTGRVILNLYIRVHDLKGLYSFFHLDDAPMPCQGLRTLTMIVIYIYIYIYIYISLVKVRATLRDLIAFWNDIHSHGEI